MSLSRARIFKADGIEEAQHCRLEPPEPSLFLVPEPEPDLTNDEVISDEEAEVLAVEARAEAERILEQARKQAQKEADELRKDAQQAAEEIMKQAREEAQALRDEAKHEGYQNGYNEGIAHANEEMAQQRDEIEKLRDLAEEDYKKRVWESEIDIIKLAIEIAGVITRTTLTTQPETWIGMAREAISKVAGAHEILIRVSPQDEPVLIENMAAIREVLTESAPIRWEADPALKPGDLWVETNIGQVDARVSQQLQTFWAALRGGAENHG